MPGLYAFDRCEVRPGERQLLIDGAPAALGARAFDLLLALIERRERVVDKAELFDAVWPGLVVEENNLQVQVSSLRKLLGPNAIATVPGRGYQFVAPLESQAPRMAASAPRTRAHPNNLPPPRTRFIGREKALADCANLLRETRLLTLSGIGGCGKTRLAQELAQRQLDALSGRRLVRRPWPAAGSAARFDDGCRRRWGFVTSPTRRSASLPITSKSRRTLIVLDNCEHVIDAAVESIETLLANCAALKSSRRAARRSAWRASRSSPCARCRCRRRRSSTRFDDPRPCGSSSTMRGSCCPTSTSTSATPRRSSRSAAVSTASRSRSSWPRRGFACSRSTRFARGSTTASGC